MSSPKSTSTGNLVLRKQLAEAALQGYLDGALSSHIGAAKAAGYQPNVLSDHELTEGPIGGINR